MSLTDEELDPLYAADLADFVFERGALVKRLRSAGRREDAAVARKLAKPNRSAWAANQLVRRYPRQAQRLWAAVDALKEAHLRDPAKLPTRRVEEREARIALAEALDVASAAGTIAVSPAIRDRALASLRAAAGHPEVRPLAEKGMLFEDIADPGLDGLQAALLQGLAPHQGRPDARRPEPALRAEPKTAASKTKSNAEKTVPNSEPVNSKMKSEPAKSDSDSKTNSETAKSDADFEPKKFAADSTPNSGPANIDTDSEPEKFDTNSTPDSGPANIDTDSTPDSEPKKFAADSIPNSGPANIDADFTPDSEPKKFAADSTPDSGPANIDADFTPDSEPEKFASDSIPNSGPADSGSKVLDSPGVERARRRARRGEQARFQRALALAQRELARSENRLKTARLRADEAVRHLANLESQHAQVVERLRALEVEHQAALQGDMTITEPGSES